MEETSISLWVIATIAGPIVLAVAIGYGVLRQRWRRRRLRERQGATASSRAGRQRQP